MTATVTCPHCSYSKELPAGALPPHGTSATCPQCRQPFVTSEKNVQHSEKQTEELICTAEQNESSTEPLSAIQQSPLQISLPVKFNTFTKRDSRFRGKGSIEIKDETLWVTGQRNRLFATGKVTENYPLTDVCNAIRDEEVVSFTVPLKKGHWAALLNCGDSSDAAKLAAALPQQTDSRFFNIDQANHELNERVATLPGGSPAVWTILTLNCLIYLIVAYTGKQWFSFNADYLTMVGGNFSPLTTEGQWWRMFTATFLHGGLLHLVFNMYALYSFGMLTEKIFGTRDFLLIYILSGLAGSAGTLMFSPSAVGVGASGAIFGVMGSMLAFLTTDRKFLSEGARKQLISNFAIFGAYSLMQGFRHSGIDNAAHIGGLLAGFVTGWGIGTPAPLLKGCREWLNARLALALCVVLIATGSVTAFSPRPYQHYKNHVAMINLLKEMAVREKALSEFLKTNAPKDNKATLADAQRFAVRMRETYSGIPEKLAEIQATTDGLRERKALLTQYISTKVASAEMFAVSLEHNDSKLLEEAKKKAEAAKKIGEGFAKPFDWNK